MYLRTCEKEASIITTKYVTANGITTTETDRIKSSKKTEGGNHQRGIFL